MCILSNCPYHVLKLQEEPNTEVLEEHHNLPNLRKKWPVTLSNDIAYTCCTSDIVSPTEVERNRTRTSLKDADVGEDTLFMLLLFNPFSPWSFRIDEFTEIKYDRQVIQPTKWTEGKAKSRKEVFTEKIVHSTWNLAWEMNWSWS